MNISVNVNITRFQVALYNELILLGVGARNDQVVFRRDEPIEFLEPERFARLGHLLHNFEILETLERLLLGRLKGLLRRVNRFSSLTCRLFFILIVEARISIR